MHLPAAIKKGDRLQFRISKEGYKDSSKQTIFSDAPIVLILGSNAVAEVVKPAVHSFKLDTGLFQNKAFAVQIIDTAGARKLDKDNLRTIFYSLSSDKSKHVSIECIKDDPEALRFATSIHDTLIVSGYKNVSDVSVVAFPKPILGQFINRDASGVKITIGHKP